MTIAVSKLTVLGGSQGGLEAASHIFKELPPDFPGALALVLHRSANNGGALARLLTKMSNLQVVEPDHGEEIQTGRVYLAPGGYHLLVDEDRFALSVDPLVSHARPSIDVLFESAAASRGSDVVGVLLSASSSDGAAGLVSIARRGGTTIVQDPSTTETDAAIQRALAAKVVDHCLSPAEIADFLARLACKPAETDMATTESTSERV